MFYERENALCILETPLVSSGVQESHPIRTHLSFRHEVTMELLTVLHQGGSYSVFSRLPLFNVWFTSAYWVQTGPLVSFAATLTLKMLHPGPIYLCYWPWHELLHQAEIVQATSLVCSFISYTCYAWSKCAWHLRGESHYWYSALGFVFLIFWM